MAAQDFYFVPKMSWPKYEFLAPTFVFLGKLEFGDSN